MGLGKSEDDDKKHQFRQRRLVLFGADPWSKDIQENIQRAIDEIPAKFSNAVEAVAKIEATLSKKEAFNGELTFARQFGEDLYAAYFQSSGVLTQTLGPELLLRAFRAVAPIRWSIVSPDEYDEYRDLPEELVLYRGGIGPSVELAKGLSWTLSKDTARAFMDAEGSIMIHAKMRKCDLLAYYSQLSECIIDPDKLASVELVEDVD